MRVCVVYDCLYPHTVGGAERWYRNLAARLAQEGHEVDYLTLRQWPQGEEAGLPGVNVVAVGPQMALYNNTRRRVLPPLLFGLGVFVHLARKGHSYDVVHTASFPYFPLLAAGALRWNGYDLLVDWHEVWTDGYWRTYLGRFAGTIGGRVQRSCVRLPQRAFCFSQLHASRLRAEGFRGEPTVLRGQYAGPAGTLAPASLPPLVVFAGRHIPEKQAPSLVPALALVRKSVSGIRGEILGDGPDRATVLRLIDEYELSAVVDAPGFVSEERVEQTLGAAACLVLPSRREGYGLVVVEAASRGTPSVVVAGPDNAAVEMIDEGINGTIAASSSADDLASAIVRVIDGGVALRNSTARWFNRHGDALSLAHSLSLVSENLRSNG